MSSSKLKPIELDVAPAPKSLQSIFISSLVLKLLLFFSYRSTDFEVHRNWLAITKHLPLNEWYTNDVSQWTLDYPPFFAYFEWVLSHLAPESVVRDGGLDLVELGQFGWPTVVYQRITVIISELVLFASLQWYINTTNDDRKLRSQAFSIAASIVLSPGLLIIDHIHFQYNGFMYGIMIFSIVAARNERLLLSGGLFSVLLCFKHIYLYLAPAYFVYLLRAYIIEEANVAKGREQNRYSISIPFSSLRINFLNALKLGIAVLSPFAIAFGPFVYYRQIPQVLARLFPFSRGLTHAYWAPNIWAIYSFVDRILSFVWVKNHVAGSTRGLVGDVTFNVLADIQPRITFFLTLFYQILALIPLLIWPSFNRFVACLTLCGFSSFLFGWHVHEKAILLVIFPFTFICLKDRRVLSAFVPLVVAGYISLFPLIFTSGEELIKLLYTFVWFVMFMLSFGHLVNVKNISKRVFLLDRISLIYMVGFVPVTITSGLIDKIVPKYEFLKLMIISVYCGIGVVGSWVGFSWLYFFDDEVFTE